MTRKAFTYGMCGGCAKSTDTINSLVHEEIDERLRGYYKQILKSAKRNNMEVLNSVERICYIKIFKELLEQSRNIFNVEGYK